MPCGWPAGVGPYNASGSVSVPFPQPPGDSPYSPSGNYTLSTYLSVDQPFGDGFIYQTIAATNSSGGGLWAQRFDYSGCLVWSLPTSLPATSNHVNEGDTASCSAALSSNNISQILWDAEATARQFSLKNRGIDACTLLQFQSSYPLIEYNEIHSIFGQPSVSNSANNDSCSAAQQGVFGASVEGDLDDKWIYDKYLKAVTPVVIVSWKNASANHGQPWAHAQLFCISANDITPGSVSGSSPSKPNWSSCYLATLSGILGFLTFIL